MFKAIPKIFRVLIFSFFGIALISLTKNNAFNNPVSQIDKLLKIPKIKAFLDTIAFAEGTFNSGYSTLYAGHSFKNFADHPRCSIGSIPYACMKKDQKHLVSTAAGRYQLLERTWDEIALKFKLKDFSPINQDRAAVYLLKQVKVIDDILNDKFDLAIKKSSRIWASLPGSAYKSNQLTTEDLKKFYLNSLKLYIPKKSRFWFF